MKILIPSQKTLHTNNYSHIHTHLIITSYSDTEKYV